MTEGADPGVRPSAEKLALLREKGVAPGPHGQGRAGGHRNFFAKVLNLTRGPGRALLNPGIAGYRRDAHKLDLRILSEHGQRHTVIKHLNHVRIQQDLFLPAGAETVRGKAEKSHKDKRYTACKDSVHLLHLLCFAAADLTSGHQRIQIGIRISRKKFSCQPFLLFPSESKSGKSLTRLPYH